MPQSHLPGRSEKNNNNGTMKGKLTIASTVKAIDFPGSSLLKSDHPLSLVIIK
jgi:hypothetical protein